MTKTNSTVSQDATALLQSAIQLPIYNEPEHEKEDHHGESSINSPDPNSFHLISLWKVFALHDYEYQIALMDINAHHLF